jgi:NIPSNAP
MDTIASHPIVELRHYTLHQGKRDTLIRLFDAEFVETQEAEGVQLIAQFRDIDRPDVFTWLRAFESMPARAASLGAFYDGPVWNAHKHVANATMIDSDDVRLLQPVRAGAGLHFDACRPTRESTDIPAGLIIAHIYSPRAESARDFPAFFEHSALPALKRAASAPPLARYETAPFENSFPRLPVRDGEHAFVTFTHFDDALAHDRHVAALAADEQWSSDVLPALERHLAQPALVWRLSYTARSRTLR